MLTMQHRSSFLTVLLGGLLLISAMGCGSSNPNIRAAESALENQNYEQALQSVNTEIEANPQNAQAYLLKGNILSQQAQAVEAAERRTELLGSMMEAYNQAVEINPGLQGQVDVRMLQSYRRTFGQGANLYNRADSLGDPELYREAAGYFESASQLRPDSSRALTLAANAYLNAGDYEAAVQPLERAIDTGTAGAGIYNTLGQLYLQQQRTEDAITLLEEARQQYPDNADLQTQLLTAYVRSGDTERAMTAYEEAIAANPQNATYRYNYGSMLLNQDRYDEAIEQLNRALEVEPGNLNAQYNLGVAYRNKAVAINDSIRALDERRSANSDQLSDQEISEIDQRINELADQRRELFRQSIEPLESARQAFQQGSPDTNLTEQQICRSLFTAYVQTNQTDMARQVEECANFPEGQGQGGQQQQ